MTTKTNDYLIKNELITLYKDCINELKKSTADLQALRLKVYENKKRRERVESWIIENHVQVIEYENKIRELHING